MNKISIERIRQIARTVSNSFARDYNDRADFESEFVLKALEVQDKAPEASVKFITTAMINRGRDLVAYQNRRPTVYGLDLSRLGHSDGGIGEVDDRLMIDRVIETCPPLSQPIITLIVGGLAPGEASAAVGITRTAGIRRRQSARRVALSNGLVAA